MGAQVYYFRVIAETAFGFSDPLELDKPIVPRRIFGKPSYFITRLVLLSVHVPCSSVGQGSQCRRPLGLGRHVGPSTIPRKQTVGFLVAQTVSWTASLWDQMVGLKGRGISLRGRTVDLWS